MHTPSFFLAEDDLDDAELFGEALHSIAPDASFQHAANGKDALEQLSTLPQKPEVIFLDINMPVMNGWECLGKIKQDAALRQIPVVMYSTSSYSKDVERAMELGALCFFTKANSFTELCDILRMFAQHLHSGIGKAIASFRNVHMTNPFACADHR